MRLASLFAVSAVLGTIAGSACSPSSESGGTAGAGATATGGAGTSSGGAGATGGGMPAGCEPPCREGQVCSVAGSCIDEGTCLEDGDCDDGTICDEDAKTCVPGGGCGTQEATVESVPPNLLIVLDRSCSMTQAVGVGQTKWDVAVAALNTMTTTFAGKIRFGLALFPDLVQPACEQDMIPIPVAPGTEMQIQMLLTAALQQNDMYFPDGPCVTNIDTAMQQATTEPALMDVDRESFVLLITDGKQAGCNVAGGDMGTTQIITDLFQQQDVGTFVIGFGSGTDPTQMNIFANAGGYPKNDPMEQYYQADDQATLDAALTAIASQTIGCVFDLDEVPPNPDEVFVFFDNVEKVDKDPTHMDGWDYDPGTNQLTFYGPACDKLKTGMVMDVDVVFGCDMPTPE